MIDSVTGESRKDEYNTVRKSSFWTLVRRPSQVELLPVTQPVVGGRRAPVGRRLGARPRGRRRRGDSRRTAAVGRDAADHHPGRDPAMKKNIIS